MSYANTCQQSQNSRLSQPVFEVYFLLVRDAVSLENRFATFRVYFIISHSVLVMSNNSMLDILTSEDEITSSF